MTIHLGGVGLPIPMESMIYQPIKGPSISDFRTTRLSLPLTASQDGGRPLDAIGIRIQNNCLFLPTVEEAMGIVRVHGSTFYSISCQPRLD